MSNTCCIILAAGEGKRMNSKSIPKVLSQVLFKPMLGWIIDSVCNSKINDICLVKGFRYEMIDEYLNSLGIKCDSVIQSERKGTAHAVMVAKEFLEKHRKKDVLILGGDSPFLDKDTILKSYAKHKSEDNSVTIISSTVGNPFGYGRIVRNKISNRVVDIVEEKDANDEQRSINEINSGAYWFKVDDLLSDVFKISDNTSQKEYYLTSIVKLFIEKGKSVNAFAAESEEIVLGANTAKQLENLNRIARDKIINYLIDNGVDIPFRDSVIVGCGSVVESGVTIYPNSMILGESFIGKGSKIGPNSQVLNSNLGERVEFNSSICKNCKINDDSKISPFSFFEDCEI